ncbi:MAG: SDR family oxidoreductase [Campylobacteraceae bacterium]|nr:SDR family oxidoreductase [Campylobacteraceae bacterium]
MKKILLAGASGYLGRYIAKELIKQGYFLKVIVRDSKKFKEKKIKANEIVEAEVTKAESLAQHLKGIDIVISTIGITRQKDGLSYMDVDYGANMNLLKEAKNSGVKKFIYISTFNAYKLKDLQIIQAKEAFVKELKNSGLDYCIVRPNGFFCDMEEIYNMAKKGSIYLFANGTLKLNPIHGKDLAEVCVSAINNVDKEINLGGPDILSLKEISNIAFEVLDKKSKIIYIPDCFRLFILKIGKFIIPSKTFGPIEFFLSAMAKDMIAPKYGKYTLKEYYLELKDKS